MHAQNSLYTAMLLKAIKEYHGVATRRIKVLTAKRAAK